MINLLLALLAMFTAPPPSIPAPLPEAKHNVERNFALEAMTNATNDSGVSTLEYRYPETRRDTKDIKVERLPLATTDNTTVAPNPIVLRNDNRTTVLGQDTSKIQGERNQRLVNQNGSIVNNVETNNNVLPRQTNTNTNQTMVATDYNSRKDQINAKYSRMFELQKNMVNKTMEIAEEMTEYQALKASYNNEMRGLISSWVDTQYQNQNVLNGTNTNNIQARPIQNNNQKGNTTNIGQPNITQPSVTQPRTIRDNLDNVTTDPQYNNTVRQRRRATRNRNSNIVTPPVVSEPQTEQRTLLTTDNDKNTNYEIAR